MDLLFPPLAELRSGPLLWLEDHRLDAPTLAAGARLAAGRLESLGVRAGDRVLVELGSGCPEILGAIFGLLGAMELGAVATPHARKLGSRALTHLRADGSPVARIGAEVGDEHPLAGLPSLLATALATAGLAAPAGAGLERAIDDAACLMLYTSGTTGPPKGVPHTPRAIASNLDALARAWEWEAGTAVVHALPLFHVHGLVLGLFGGLRHGGGLRYLPRFEPGTLAAAVGEHRGLLFAVPTMFHRMLEAAGGDPAIGEGLRSAARLISGSAPLPRRVHGQIAELCGQQVFERYGLTETLINCAVPVAGGADPGFVGPPLPGIELELVADDGLTPVPSDGETLGEVRVRGPGVMAGYHGGRESEAVDAQGWFRTGDIGARRPDGSLRLVGRRSVDLIKSGGYRIGAGEVEAALLELPGVAEVAVVGMPDEDLGQRIEAFVVPAPGARPDPAALIQGVADALAPHQRPRAVHLREQLPRNALGKVQKVALLKGEG